MFQMYMGCWKLQIETGKSSFFNEIFTNNCYNEIGKESNAWLYEKNDNIITNNTKCSLYI